MRFYADDDSFNENLVKENRSEISGRWELKMAALREGGHGGSIRGALRGGTSAEEGTQTDFFLACVFQHLTSKPCRCCVALEE